jgi:murein L,D-transpeptidase YcbB/YkuD
VPLSPGPSAPALTVGPQPPAAIWRSSRSFAAIRRAYSALGPGDSGTQVIALRDRLMAMGYLAPTATRTYDDAMAAAVRAFQAAHGLEEDGAAGSGTLEAINTSPEARLQSVIVAMERERWLGDDRGDRHIWVNLADFTAAIVDNDIVTFRTRSVIGSLDRDRQSPEFSDLMEFMVINPTWYVPRSIIVRDYLPQLQRNAGALGHLRITNSQGQVVNRGAVNFSAYNARNFPFAMQQPPSASNALGVVKFMFPNQYNIYLHDTPARELFSHPVRAYSNGCIRLRDPRDFAFALLARQTDDPEGFFNARLETGNETRVDLEVPVPVHLDYRTAFTDVTGALQHRPDIYGRDAKIWQALAAEGVDLATVSG